MFHARYCNRCGQLVFYRPDTQAFTWLRQTGKTATSPRPTPAETQTCPWCGQPLALTSTSTTPRPELPIDPYSHDATATPRRRGPYKRRNPRKDRQPC